MEIPTNEEYQDLTMVIPSAAEIEQEIDWLGGKKQEEVARKLAELKILKDLWKDAALTDLLTGLLNTRGLIYAFTLETRLFRLEKDVAKEERRELKQPSFDGYSILGIDLIGLAELNNRQGREIGNATIKSLAEITTRSVREGVDLVGRIDGDEMAIASINGTVESLAALGNRVSTMSTSEWINVNLWGGVFDADVPIDKALIYAKKMADLAKGQAERNPITGRAVHAHDPIYVQERISKQTVEESLRKERKVNG